MDYTIMQGGDPPARPGRVREFDIGRGEVREIRQSWGNFGLPVLCYRSCSSHKTDITLSPNIGSA